MLHAHSQLPRTDKDQLELWPASEGPPAILELDHLLEQAVLLAKVVDFDLELAVLCLELANVTLDGFDVCLLFGAETSS